jgi:hypothetical protein
MVTGISEIRLKFLEDVKNSLADDKERLREDLDLTKLSWENYFLRRCNIKVKGGKA